MKLISLMMGILMLFTLSGCSSFDNRDAATIGGGVAGGVAGSMVTGGSPAGAVVGATGGALIGNQLAK